MALRWFFVFVFLFHFVNRLHVVSVMEVMTLKLLLLLTMRTSLSHSLCSKTWICIYFMCKKWWNSIVLTIFVSLARFGFKWAQRSWLKLNFDYCMHNMNRQVSCVCDDNGDCCFYMRIQSMQVLSTIIDQLNYTN